MSDKKPQVDEVEMLAARMDLEQGKFCVKVIEAGLRNETREDLVKSGMTAAAHALLPYAAALVRAREVVESLHCHCTGTVAETVAEEKKCPDCADVRAFLSSLDALMKERG